MKLTHVIAGELWGRCQIAKMIERGVASNSEAVARGNYCMCASLYQEEITKYLKTFSRKTKII